MKNKRAYNFIDITGQKFNYLTIVKLDRVEKKRSFWECLCDCGKITIKDGAHIRKGSTKSCGCYKHRKVDRGESSFNSLYLEYKIGADKRGLDFDLTKEQFKILTKQNCHYCNVKPAQELVNRCKKLSKEAQEYGKYIYNGVDRKDNSIGYILENALPCCRICNRAKWTLGYDEFIEYIERFKTLKVEK